MIKAVLRLLRLWRLYAAMDLLLIARDLKLFLSYYVSDTLINIAAVTGVLLLAERFAGIGIWSKAQVIFLLGYATVSSGLMDTFFGYNILHISRRIGRGQLDHTLIQPQPLWMSLLTEGFLPFSSSGILLAGIGLLVWATRGLPVRVTPLWLALLLLDLAASAAIILSFSFLWGSLAFWAPRAAEEINSTTVRLMSQLRSFPLDTLSHGLMAGLLTVVPVGFVAWYPSRYFVGLSTRTEDALVTPAAALVFATVATLVFQKGLCHYARVGSQRYGTQGHRR